MSIKNPISLFYSYAHNDEILRNELDKHLSLLQKRGLIDQWYDRDISAGVEWANLIDYHIDTAQIILLLVSPDFLASDYCYSIEMKRALERHDKGKAHVIPILLRPVDWQVAPFAKLQILPQNMHAVTAWPNQDLAFMDIAIQIRKVVEELLAISSLHQGNFMSSAPQLSQEDMENEQIKTVRNKSENFQQESIFPHIHQALDKLRLYQKTVSELKSIHNMLHEIELQLYGLSATIQLIPQVEKKSIANRLFVKREIEPETSNFGYIEISWRQTLLKINDLEYFAAKVMEVLEDERFHFDTDGVRGPVWAKDLFILRQSFEARMRERDMKAVKNLSEELLITCHSHLYRIDKRLMEAVKELDFAADLIQRYRA